MPAIPAMPAVYRIERLLEVNGALTSAQITQRLHLHPETCEPLLIRLMKQGTLARQSIQFSPRTKVTFRYWIRSCGEPDPIDFDKLPTAVKILCFLQSIDKTTMSHLVLVVSDVSVMTLHAHLTNLRKLGLVGVEKGEGKGAREPPLLYCWCPRWYYKNHSIPDGIQTRSSISPEPLRLLYQGPMTIPQLEQKAQTVPKGRMFNYVCVLESSGLVQTVWIERPPSSGLGYGLAKILTRHCEHSTAMEPPLTMRM